MFSIGASYDVIVDADFFEDGDDIFCFGDCFAFVVKDDRKGDVIVEFVSTFFDYVFWTGGSNGTCLSEFFLFFVDYYIITIKTLINTFLIRVTNGIKNP